METMAAVLMALFGTVYFQNKKTHKIPALVCKAAATSIPAWLLILQPLCPDVPAVVYGWTYAAILCYMAADILLECRFTIGAAVFAGGHICMTAGFLQEMISFAGEGGDEPAGRLFLYGACFFVLFMTAAYMALRRYILHLKKKVYLAAAYVALLSMMASCASVSGVQNGSLLPVAGGVSFVMSDILLGINRLGKKRSKVRGAAVLILYYLSVYLLARRLWH